MSEPQAQPHKAPPPPVSTTHPKTVAETDVHLLDHLAVLYRYRYIAVSVFLLTTVAVMIQGYSSVKLFEAQGRLLIETERATAIPGLTSDAQFYEDPQLYYNTQYRILKGRDLTRRVIRKLRLETYPEFNGTAVPPRTPMTVLNDLEQRAIQLVKPAPKIEPRKPDEAADEAGLIDAFLGRVIVEPVRDSRLVDVTFRSIDATFAATAANTLMDEYVAQNLAVKLQTSGSTLEWLQSELTKQQQKVEDSERALAEYREKQNAMSLDDKQNVVLSRYNKLNDELMRARTERTQKQAVYDQVRSMSSGTSPDAIPAIAQNPQVVAAKGRLVDLQRQRTTLTERYGDKHPQVIANRTAVDDARDALDVEVTRAVQSVRNEYETAVLQEQTIGKALGGAKVDVQDLGRKSVDYNVMEREAKSNHIVYDTLLQQEKELRVSSSSRTNNVRIVDRAELPRAPITPAGRRTWLLSVAVGLALAVAVAFGLDYMNDTVKTPEDVSQRLKLPFLGLVPTVRGDEYPLLASSQVPHDFGESFRSLRTALLSKHPGPGTKLLAVTSAQPLEGKTITAANLAMALAYGGARVLLIDADMRRPGLHRPLRLTNERGLSQVLSGQARVRDVIQRTVDPNLLAITAGKVPPNPSELLSSERMKTLLTNLATGAFDWIVIDTPPVLAVTDAVILAPAVAGVVYVVGSEMTRRRLAERALELIQGANPRSVAVVLNKVDFARNRFYYSRYYGHQYKNYYAGASV
jgi:capsular exopolysaccharide synthesis family protein